MNYSNRIFLYGPVGLFAILILAVMGYWWTASSAFSQRLDAANGHDIAPGIHFSFAKKTMAGFPFRVDTELEGVRVEITTSHGPTVWTAEHFAAHSLTYGRAQFVFEAAGKQHVEWHDDAGQLHTYDFLPGSLRASAITDGTSLTRFDLDLLDDDAADVSAARVQIHLRDDPKIDGLDLFLSADGVHIAPDLKPAFGSDVKHLAISALVSPGSSFSGFLGGHDDWRNATQNWHAQHGGVLIKNIELDWGNLHATGQGALTVDDVHRPLGAVHLAIADWPKLSAQLSAPNAAGEAKGLAAGLTAFAAIKPPLGDTLPATVALKDGVLFIGQVPADLLSPLY